jgi:hypothetical protein
MNAPGPQRQVAPSFFSNTGPILGTRPIAHLAGPYEMSDVLDVLTEELASLQAAVLLNLAMDNMMRILAMPVPSPNDTSPEAQLVRALMLAVADVVPNHAALGAVH